MQESLATNGSLPGCLELVNPPYAKREQRFSAEGGESPNLQVGGAESRTGGGEGLPGCTSEALGARKLGRGRAERRRASFTPRGMLPRFSAREGERGR